MFQVSAIITVITEPVFETARERRGSLQNSNTHETAERQEIAYNQILD
jgi:hypothetical protein